jgi:hypothetical protein
MWGLFDMIILHLSRSHKILIYTSIIASIVILLEFKPHLLDHFVS